LIGQRCTTTAHVSVASGQSCITYKEKNPFLKNSKKNDLEVEIKNGILKNDFDVRTF